MSPFFKDFYGSSLESVPESLEAGALLYDGPFRAGFQGELRRNISGPSGGIELCTEQEVCCCLLSAGSAGNWEHVRTAAAVLPIISPLVLCLRSCKMLHCGSSFTLHPSKHTDTHTLSCVYAGPLTAAALILCSHHPVQRKSA